MTLSHSPNIVRDGLVLYLDAANSKSYPGTGTTWTDLSGNEKNGTLVNGVGYDVNNNGSFTFDGSNDFILFDSLLNVGNTFTIIAWIDPSIKTRQTVFSNGYPYQNNKGFFMCCPGNNTSDMFLSLGRDQKVVVSSTNAIQNNVIQMITAVANGSLNLMKFFVNENEVSNYALQSDANISLEYDAGILVIGKRDTTNYDRLSDTNLYLIQVYNRALSESEIQQNFNALRGRYGI